MPRSHDSPHLFTSITHIDEHHGEARPGLVERRDQRMDLNSADARRQRADLARLAKPQGGVSALAAQFPSATRAPEGVRDNGDRNVGGVPVITVRRR
ncbi:MAG TPA: hypothetical protein VJ596_03830 [Gemmatimonadaceae bacterium]|nr:hypothetical protein [Gemmatimonadaceae bacterium]